MIRSVLVVCEGNICRSPLAAALLARELPHIDVASAGTHALVGEPADKVIAELAKNEGVSLHEHIAMQVDEQLVRSADLILTMTRAQINWIFDEWPFARGKVFRLCDEERIDVSDPHKRHRAIFDAAHAQIRIGISQWSRKLAGNR
jgi:protein-tyrosine phosphatase